MQKQASVFYSLFTYTLSSFNHCVGIGGVCSRSVATASYSTQLYLNSVSNMKANLNTGPPFVGFV